MLEIPSGATLHRFYTAAYDPIFFDKSKLGRFNSPDGSFGVLYTAGNTAGAFAETFLRTPGRTLIDIDFMRRKAYVRLTVTRTLKLIRLAGPGLARLGATAEVTHGGLPYDVPQAWSTALWKNPIEADGIAYYSRHDDDEICHGLFDRAERAIVEDAHETNLDQDWFWKMAEKYRVGVAP
nr:RES family NAD+ phosphorylase [Sinorhizobium terangae]